MNESIVSITSIVIALMALLISIYVVFRDRKSQKFNNLLNCRQRIFDAFDTKDILTVDEMIEFFEENPHTEDAQKAKAKSQDVMRKVEREFEFTCYLITRKQLDFMSFFDIFKRWISMRSFAFDQKQYKRANLPFTWEIIQLCKKKKLLPLKT